MRDDWKRAWWWKEVLLSLWYLFEPVAVVTGILIFGALLVAMMILAAACVVVAILLQGLFSPKRWSLGVWFAAPLAVVLGLGYFWPRITTNLFVLGAALFLGFCLFLRQGCRTKKTVQL